jgi:hypothetical protein
MLPDYFGFCCSVRAHQNGNRTSLTPDLVLGLHLKIVHFRVIRSCIQGGLTFAGVMNEFGKTETISGLIGLIWRVRDNLSFDVGLRHAITNGHPVNEVRAGLTFGFPLGQFGGRSAQSR